MTDSNAFLPTDYIVKSPNSGYMRLEEGDNRIRILTKPIMGHELWMNNKPKRVRMGEAFTHRRYCGGLDIFWCRKIGLAKGYIYDLFSLCQ